MFCVNNKLRTLVVTLTLQQVTEVSASVTQQNNNNACNYTPQFYIILALSITILGLVIFAILQVRRIKLCRGQLFSNVAKIKLFISDMQYYMPIKLCKTAGIRNIDARQGKDKKALYLGYFRNRLERG